METKEIKEILSEIGITEETCHIMTSAYTSIPIHDIVVDYIQQFMNHIETNEMNKLMMHLKDNPMFSEYLKTPRIDCLDFLLIENNRLTEENKRLKDFEDKHISQWGKEIT